MLDIDPTWLRTQYKKGIAIVAINTPINPLAKMLDHEITPAVIDGKGIPQADLPIRHDQVLVSVFHNVFDPNSQEITGWGWYSSYHQHVDAVPPLVSSLLYNNHKH